MSLKDAKQNAEKVLDSAEMVLETIPEPKGKAGRELESKAKKLRSIPEEAKELRDLTKEVRELMEEAQEEAAREPSMEGDMGGRGGMGSPGEPARGQPQPRGEGPPF
jgi:chromosome segregation ATPase